MVSNHSGVGVRLSTPPENMSEKSLIDLIVDSIQDIKGKNIISLDLRQLDDSPADYFVICEGDSRTQIKAISDNIYKRVKEHFKMTPNHTEGADDLACHFDPFG